MQGVTHCFLSSQYHDKVRAQGPFKHPHRPVIELAQTITDVCNFEKIKRVASLATTGLTSLASARRWLGRRLGPVTATAVQWGEAGTAGVVAGIGTMAVTSATATVTAASLARQGTGLGTFLSSHATAPPAIADRLPVRSAHTSASAVPLLPLLTAATMSIKLRWSGGSSKDLHTIRTTAAHTEDGRPAGRAQDRRQNAASVGSHQRSVRFILEDLWAAETAPRHPPVGQSLSPVAAAVQRQQVRSLAHSMWPQDEAPAPVLPARSRALARAERHRPCKEARLGPGGASPPSIGPSLGL